MNMIIMKLENWNKDNDIFKFCFILVDIVKKIISLG